MLDYGHEPGYLGRSDPPPMIVARPGRVPQYGPVLSRYEVFWRGMKIDPSQYNVMILGYGQSDECLKWWAEHCNNLGFMSVRIAMDRPNEADIECCNDSRQFDEENNRLLRRSP